MVKVLLASANPGKLVEMRALLEDLPIELVTPAQSGISIEIDESGDTYAENAAIKAQTCAQLAGLISLGDDSGLEVEALGGLPGIHSKRFSPNPAATDADRRAYLLAQLSDRPRPWKARFLCTVALATPAGELYIVKGECPGEIIPEERGQNGFGYDPIFLLKDMNLTMAELPTQVKNRLSHRGRAIQASIPILTDLISRIG